GFSIMHLFRFLNAFDQDVEIVVKTTPLSDSQARTRVVAL
ncbi:MAG: XRE family transcriptional regulator, partial [Symploca sp. SIO2E6]|nr:XRE family transcriptional regulator [Symploca sp. SIO2E6]NET62792.1 XRE family transcriptional regulator [Symploca sp. SIO2E6]